MRVSVAQWVEYLTGNQRSMSSIAVYDTDNPEYFITFPFDFQTSCIILYILPAFPFYKL